jgi:hypothetical protein
MSESNQYPYFIFTSGEKGLKDRDWAVKFCSHALGSLEKVDFFYYETTSQFQLDPRLERPDSKDNEFGIIALPWSRYHMMLGMILPYSDHPTQGQRPNISLLAIVLPGRYLENELTPESLTTFLWESELWKLALRVEDRPEKLKQRPELLSIPISSSVNKGISLNRVQWPSQGKGTLYINGQFRLLEFSPPSFQKKSIPLTTIGPSKQKTKLFISNPRFFAIIGILIFFGSFVFWYIDGTDKEVKKLINSPVSSSVDTSLRKRKIKKIVRFANRKKIPEKKKLKRPTTKVPKVEKRDSLSTGKNKSPQKTDLSSEVKPKVNKKKIRQPTLTPWKVSEVQKVIMTISNPEWDIYPSHGKCELYIENKLSFESGLKEAVKAYQGKHDTRIKEFFDIWKKYQNLKENNGFIFHIELTPSRCNSEHREDFFESLAKIYVKFQRKL